MAGAIVARTERARGLRRNTALAEYRLWYVLRNRGLDGLKFVRQLPVGPFFADFACREAALIIEIDGGQHNGSKSDMLRTARLNGEGYSVLRFWNSDVLDNRDGVIEAIRLTLAGSPSPDWRFAPATLSPMGRGTRGARGASAFKVARSIPVVVGQQILDSREQREWARSIPLPVGERSSRSGG